MRILITNDDGVYAPGIKALHEALKDIAQCTVLAPFRDMSGTSNALTLDRSLYCHHLDNGFIALDGTPADCTHMAFNGLLDVKPEVVVSGINLGANLGDDVLYSGTVGAATEGRFATYSPFAFSLVSRDTTHLPTAAYFAKKLVQEYVKISLPKHTIFNVNIPDMPLDQIKGVQITRLGHRTHSTPVVKSVNPRGKEGYWISVSGDIEDGDDGTDFNAIAQGYVSVTPIHIDRSCYQTIDRLRSLEKK